MSEIIEGLKLADGGKLRICTVCGNAFAAYRNAHGTEQKRCPRCCDAGLHPHKRGGTYTRQREVRPSRIVERRQVVHIPGVKISFPIQDWWKPVANADGDTPSYKLDVPGSLFGHSWQGRLVVYAHRPWAEGDVVAVREMVAVHEVRATYEDRPTSGFTQLRGGPEVVTRRTVHPLTAEVEGSVVEREERPYIVLEYTNAPQLHERELVWLTARTKTTLKGFGRQIHSRIEGGAVWMKSVDGGLRSGRAYTEAVLAVVDRDTHLEVIEHSEPGLQRDDLEMLRVFAPSDADPFGDQDSDEDEA